MPSLVHARNMFDVISQITDENVKTIYQGKYELLMQKNISSDEAVKKIMEEMVLKSFSLSGKVDFQTAKGRDIGVDLGFELASKKYCVGQFCPSIQIPIGFKSNDTQTSWKTGINLRGYEYIGTDYLLPFATIGTGYVDANNAPPSIYGVVGGGIDIPIPFIKTLNNKSLFEIAYEYYRADNHMYVSHNAKKLFDQNLAFSIKFFWN